MFGPDSAALNLAWLGALMQSVPLAPISLFQRNDESLKILRGFIVKANELHKSTICIQLIVNVKLLKNKIFSKFIIANV